MKLFYCEACGAVAACQEAGREPVTSLTPSAQIRVCQAVRLNYASTDEGAAEPCGGRLHHVTPGMLG